MKIVGVRGLREPEGVPLSILRGKNLRSRPPKIGNVYKIVGAHLQYVNNHYAKFEYKRTKTVGVTDYTNQTPPMHFGWEKV